MAQAAFTLDEAISQKGRMCGAVGLLRLSLLNKTVLPKSREHLLDNLSVLGSWCATEDVKIDLEPGVDVAVNGIILGTKGCRIYTFCKGLCFGSRTIFVGTADI